MDIGLKETLNAMTLAGGCVLLLVFSIGFSCGVVAVLLYIGLRGWPL